MHQRSILVGVLCAASLLSWGDPVMAQTDAKVSREREALRRSQAALREAQDQQNALTRDKAALEAEKKARDEELQRASAKLLGARGESAHLQQRVAELSAALDQAKAAATTERETAGRQADALGKRLDTAERLLAERTQTVASLRQLLERATGALAAAEEANRKMYGFGRDLIEGYRQATPSDQFLQSDPVIGFVAVRRENVAEELRSKLDATRIAPAR